jgi:pimeloyl-ACP methyl ester carboxylesterase
MADWRYRTVSGAGDAPLNVVEAGTTGAPGILFLHGFSHTHLSFGAQLADAALGREHQLVAMDLRGHGNSAKPWAPADYTGARFADDVAAVVAATGLVRPVIVAWSFGGLVAMHYVRQFGVAAIAGLNLVGTAAQLVILPVPAASSGGGPDPDWVRWTLSGNVAENQRATERSATSLTAHPLPAAVAERTLRAALTMPAYAKRAIGAAPGDNRDLLPVLRLPVLITAGALDPIAPLAAATAAAAALPQARLSAYPAAGHSPFAEEPERFNRELADFVRTARAGPGR